MVKPGNLVDHFYDFVNSERNADKLFEGFNKYRQWFKSKLNDITQTESNDSMILLNSEVNMTAFESSRHPRQRGRMSVRSPIKKLARINAA